MRKSVLLLGPALFGAIAFACEDDSSTPDGGTIQIPEAGLPDTQYPDIQAPPPTDAGDAGPKNVTVTVTGRGGPKANVTVVFHDATGAVLETKKTGVDGKATSSGAIPSMATALLGGGNVYELLTWVGVAAGDDLAARDVEDFPYPGAYSISFPPDAGSFYRAWVGQCNAGSVNPPVSLPAYYPDCNRALNAVLLRGEDLRTGNVVAYAFVKDAGAPKDGGPSVVNLASWTAPGNVLVSVTNPPVTPVVAHFAEVANNQGFSSTVNGFVIVDGGAPFPVAPGFADSAMGAVSMETGVLGGELVLGRRVSPAASMSFDMAQVLPPINASDVSATNQQRPTISWTPGASLAATKGGVIQQRFGGPQDANYVWTFVVPPSATKVDAPALPPVEAANWLPPASDAFNAFAGYTPDVAFVDGDFIPSAAVFRQQAGNVVVGLDGTRGLDGSPTPILPANNTNIKITRLSPVRGE